MSPRHHAKGGRHRIDYAESAVEHVLAVGLKDRERVIIGGEEIEL